MTSSQMMLRDSGSSSSDVNDEKQDRLIGSFLEEKRTTSNRLQHPLELQLLRELAFEVAPEKQYHHPSRGTSDDLFRSSQENKGEWPQQEEATTETRGDDSSCTPKTPLRKQDERDKEPVSPSEERRPLVLEAGLAAQDPLLLVLDHDDTADGTPAVATVEEPTKGFLIDEKEEKQLLPRAIGPTRDQPHMDEDKDLNGGEHAARTVPISERPRNVSLLDGKQGKQQNPKEQEASAPSTLKNDLPCSVSCEKHNADCQMNNSPHSTAESEIPLAVERPSIQEFDLLSGGGEVVDGEVMEEEVVEEEVCLCFAEENVSEAIAAVVFDEALRILKPGGLVYVLDIDGKTVQAVPGMRELLLPVPPGGGPHFDQKAAEIMRRNGTGNVLSSAQGNEPRLSRWLGIKPIPYGINSNQVE